VWEEVGVGPVGFGGAATVERPRTRRDTGVERIKRWRMFSMNMPVGMSKLAYGTKRRNFKQCTPGRGFTTLTEVITWGCSSKRSKWVLCGVNSSESAVNSQKIHPHPST
jgi:hypothetical protein